MYDVLSCILYVHKFIHDVDEPSSSHAHATLLQCTSSSLQEAKMLELSESVEDLRLQRRHRVDRCTLLRFLRGEKGKVWKAQRKLREAIKFIEEKDVLHATVTWDLEAYERRGRKVLLRYLYILVLS